MLVFFISAAIAWLTAPLVIRLYRQQHWVDDPKHQQHVKHTHQQAVPRGGGVIIFVAVLLTSICFLHIDKYLLAILLAASVLAITGVIDDIFDISPIVRFAINIVAGLIIVGSGIGIAYVSNPLAAGVIHLNQPQLAFELFGKTHTIWLLADLFALVFIVWNMNAINWAKGVDGQLPGFVCIALIFIGILSTKFIDDPTQFNTQELSLIVAGAYLGLLYWNWYPQKIMPGYGAGSLAGFFLSVLSILAGAKVATTLMVLAIPTADGIFTILRRILAGKSPFFGDRGHLHHKLMDILGWGRRRVAVFYWLSSLILGFLSLILDTKGKIAVIMLVVVFVFSLQVFFKLKSSQSSGVTH